MANFLTKLFGSRNQRLLRLYGKVVEAANGYADEYEQLSDDDLKAKTAEFRERLEADEELDALLPEAFATVRESARRTLGLWRYTKARSLKCAPVKARRWWPHCLPTRMH